jgi:hypothetical protein
VILHEIRRASHYEELDHGSLRIETGGNPGPLSPPDAPVYGWYTEGFDTADLKEAKRLLEELA